MRNIVCDFAVFGGLTVFVWPDPDPRGARPARAGVYNSVAGYRYLFCARDVYPIPRINHHKIVGDRPVLVEAVKHGDALQRARQRMRPVYNYVAV